MPLNNREFKSLISKFLKTKNYDPFLHVKIEELYSKDANGNLIDHSQVKWLGYIRESIKMSTPYCQTLQKAIAMHPKLSNNLAHDFLASKNIFGSTAIEFCKRDDMDLSLQQKAYNIAKKLAPTLFESEFDIKTFTTTLTKNVQDLLLNDAILLLKDGNFSLNKSEETIFYITDNNGKINDLLDNATSLPEYILTEIVSNPNLSDDVRNKAFDMGCNWLDILNHTKHTATTIYPNIIIYTFDDKKELQVDDLSEKEVMDVYSDGTLREFLINNLLSKSCKRDFLNRVISENPDMNGRISKMFKYQLRNENDLDLLNDLGLLFLTDNLKYKRHFTSFLLANKNFVNTEMYDRIISFYTIEFLKQVEDTKLVDKAIKDSLFYSIKNNGIPQVCQDDIVKCTIKYLKENQGVLNNGEDRFKETVIKYFKGALSTLLQSPHVSSTTCLLAILQQPKANITLLANLSIAAENWGNNPIEQKTKFFNAIKYSETDDKFNVGQISGEDYEMILSILKATKKLPSNCKVANIKEINKIISEVKRFGKTLIEVEGFDKALSRCQLQTEKNNILLEIEKLKVVDIVNFYIKSKDLEKRYVEILEKEKHFPLSRIKGNKEYERLEEDYR